MINLQHLVAAQTTPNSSSLSVSPTIAAARWTWLSGANFFNQLNRLGTIGVPATGNVPGARGSHAMVMDGRNGGAMYVHGGIGASPGASETGYQLTDTC